MRKAKDDPAKDFTTDSGKETGHEA